MEVSQTLRDYYLARVLKVLAIHSMFDDLDLISRSQECQNHNRKLFLDS